MPWRPTCAYPWRAGRIRNTESVCSSAHRRVHVRSLSFALITQLPAQSAPHPAPRPNLRETGVR